MTATANFRQMAQHIGLAICGLMMRTAFGVFGILWGIIREIVNGVFRVAIGVIVAILSTIAFFGFILWLFILSGGYEYLILLHGLFQLLDQIRCLAFVSFNVLCITVYDDVGN